MAERPASLRLARGADAVCLAACAVLLAAGPAYAAIIDSGGMDPSAAGSDIAWERPGTGGIMETGGHQVVLPGDVPAVGGSLVAWRNGSQVTVATRATLAPVLQFDAAGVDRLAVSDSWVAFRRTGRGRDTLEARAIGSPQTVRPVLSVDAPDQIGRPVLDGQRLVFDVTRGTQTSIVSVDLARRQRQTLRHGKNVQYLHPTLDAGRLLYVKVTRCRQELDLSRPGHDRVLLRAAPMAAQDVGYEPGHTSQGGRRPCRGGPRGPGDAVLGTTALAPGAALVTLLHVQGNGALQPSLVSVPR
jgi:hypothetical protein